MVVKGLLAALTVVVAALIGVLTNLVTADGAVPGWLWVAFGCSVAVAVALGVTSAVRGAGPVALFAPSVALARRHAALRKAVRRLWIDQLLREAVDPVSRFAVPLSYHRLTPHTFGVAPPSRPREVELGRSVLDLFDDADGRLLVVGGPGSGKTVLLLELAEALLARAETVTEPVPLVLHLSSWSGGSLEAWIAEQTRTHYGRAGFSRKAVGQWLREGLLVPLLDGLDEVDPARRDGCVDAIRAFAEDPAHAGVVVTSRAEPLRPSGLVGETRIGELPDEVVRRYLRQVDTEHLGPDHLTDDAEFRALLATPLMLSTVGANLHAVDHVRLPNTGDTEQARRELLAAYVAELLARPRAPLSRLRRYGSEAIRAYLALFARNTAPGGVFYPDFVADLAENPYRVQRAIRWGAAVLTGVAVFVVLATVAMPDDLARDGWSGGVVMSAILAAVVYFSHDPGGALSTRIRWAMAPAREMTMKFLTGAWGLTGILLLGATIGFVRDTIDDGPVRAWESWGLPFLGISPLEQLITVIALPMLFGAPLGFLAGLVVGLVGAPSDAPARPMAATHASRGNLVAGVVLGPLCGLLVGAGLAAVVDPSDAYGGGLMAGIVCGNLIALRSGGAAYIAYLATRTSLSRQGILPWRLLAFLAQATDRLLLRRAGGGFLFPHRLIQECLAD
ncbi:hypothetical protein JOD54_004082 [Actinokineospora baliensis]|uniref:NACHT domain-containing protein n=1 Tax=Actinokineospora baliensis TaxID=547056 RepID=UPI0019598F0B|nr:hypothetical protein [Actinokineospora baliensis]MBM7773878.1 hypothetical protein [Actinokineospora baliensis]